jgi:hypothetical protein
MPRGDSKLPPLARFRDPHGTVVMGWVAPKVVYTRADGHWSEGLAGTFAGRLERLIWNETGVRLFTDLWQLEDYALPARDKVVEVIKAQRKRIDSIDVLVRSRVVALGAKAVALAVGGKVNIHARPPEFTSLLERGAPNLHAMLYPSIRPKPDSDWT